MSSFRLLPLVLVTSLGGFVFGCSLFGDDGAGGSSSGAAGNGGVAGAGGAGSSSSSSSSSGVPMCTDHTTLDETNCSLIKQNCKKPGDICVPNGTGTTCIYGPGVKTQGASCTEPTECAGGLLCVFFVCTPICCPSEEQAFCGNAKCNVSTGINGKVLNTCNFAKSCTLFGNDCPENQQCRMSDFDQELALCAPASDNLVDEGGPCGFLNDCGANQRCVGNVCRYTCLNDAMGKGPGEGGCPVGQTCNPISPTYGECAPP